jgi:D-alanyl-D-alanine carboxypeptidase
MVKFFFFLFFISFSFGASASSFDPYLLRNTHFHPLPSDYVPHDLVFFSEYGIKVSDKAHREEQQIREILINDLSLLVKRCELPEYSLSVRSGFRSHGLQAITFDNYGALYSALPGESEHQLGLAVDFETYFKGEKQFLLRSNPVYQCLSQHAYKHGFLRTYTKNNPYLVSEEPWHWRYVGKRASRYAFESGYLANPWKIFEEETKSFLTKSVRDLERIAFLQQKLEEILRGK